MLSSISRCGNSDGTVTFSVGYASDGRPSGAEGEFNTFDCQTWQSKISAVRPVYFIIFIACSFSSLNIGI
jgi:hypothetical protein